MLNLSGSDRAQLRKSIQAAYSSEADLSLFVDEKLSKNLAVIAGSGPLKHVVHSLITEAIAKGFVERLILALAEDEETDNPLIRNFCARVLSQYVQLEPRMTSEGTSLLPGLPLTDAEANWGIKATSEELQLFLPKQFSFEADVGLLQQGLDLAESVCKITFADCSPVDCSPVENGEESGTGVLIAPDLVLTNYHVLSLDAETDSGADLEKIARSAQFQFGNISARLGKRKQPTNRTAVAQNAIVSASPIHQLDYALIRLNPLSDMDSGIWPVPLAPDTPLAARSPLHILQHPEGKQLKVSLSNNGIVKTDEKRGLVLYVNATKEGSSGAPCFNEQWELVALHHKAIATSFGSVREGILYRAIHREISSFL